MKVEKTRDGKIQICDKTAFGADYAIAHVYEGGPIAEANARLMAAAPEMLAALEHLAKYGKQCDVRFIARQAIQKTKVGEL